MLTHGTPVLPSLCETDRDIAEIHAELHAHRIALLRSILHTPDDFAGREPMWIALFRLRREAANTLDRIADALQAIGQSSPADRGVRFPVERAGGTFDMVPSWQLYPYLGATEPGVLPLDAGAADAMPADESDRLPALSG